MSTLRQLRRNARSWSLTSRPDDVSFVNSYVAGKRKPSIELSFQSLRNSRGGTAAPLASR